MKSKTPRRTFELFCKFCEIPVSIHSVYNQAITSKLQTLNSQKISIMSICVNALGDPDVELLVRDMPLIECNSNVTTLIPVHRQVLATASDFFQILLMENQFKECNQAQISVQASIEAFKIMLEFLYTGQINTATTPNCLMEVFELSQRYFIPPLELQICQAVEAWISLENVFELLDIAAMFRSTILSQTCYTFIAPVMSEVFAMDDFLHTDQIHFDAIWSRASCISDFTRFKTLKTRLTYHPEGPHTEKLLKQIDLNKMCNSQLRDEVAPSKLFTEKIVMDILEFRNWEQRTHMNYNRNYSHRDFVLIPGPHQAPKFNIATHQFAISTLMLHQSQRLCSYERIEAEAQIYFHQPYWINYCEFKAWSCNEEEKPRFRVKFYDTEDICNETVMGSDGWNSFLFTAVVVQKIRFENVAGSFHISNLKVLYEFYETSTEPPTPSFGLLDEI